MANTTTLALKNKIVMQDLTLQEKTAVAGEVLPVLHLALHTALVPLCAHLFAVCC